MRLHLRAFGLTLALAASSAGAAPWAWRVAPGDRLTYKLDYRSVSELNFAGLTKKKGDVGETGAPQKIRVNIKGELQATAVLQAEGTTTLAVRLVKPAVKMQSEGEDQPEVAATIAQGLEKLAFVEADPQGRIKGLRFEGDGGADTQLPLRALLSLLQFVLPEGESTPKTWKVKETEPNGDYTARYTQAGKDADGKRLVKKSKMEFAEEAPAEGPHEISVRKQIRSKGEMTFSFDVAKGRVVSVLGDELQTVLLNGKAVGKGTTKLKLELTDAQKLAAEELQPLADQAGQRAKAGPLISLKTGENKAAVEQDIAEGELKGTNADKLFAELAKIEESGGDDQPVYLKLKALFQLQPQTAARAGELLGKAKSDGPTVRILAGALGTVGNDQCQAALAAGAKARAPNDPALATILPAMGELASPGQAAEDALRALAVSDSDGEGASTARLALGTMASTLARSAPERAKKIVADLSAQAEKSGSDEVKRQLLLALGNTASADALSALKAGVAAKNPDLREASAKALGQIRTAEADQLLKSIENDADEHVRKAAQDALAARKQN